MSQKRKFSAIDFLKYTVLGSVIPTVIMIGIFSFNDKVKSSEANEDTNNILLSQQTSNNLQKSDTTNKSDLNYISLYSGAPFKDQIIELLLGLSSLILGIILSFIFISRRPYHQRLYASLERILETLQKYMYDELSLHRASLKSKKTK